VCRIWFASWGSGQAQSVDQGAANFVDWYAFFCIFLPYKGYKGLRPLPPPPARRAGGRRAKRCIEIDTVDIYIYNIIFNIIYIYTQTLAKNHTLGGPKHHHSEGRMGSVSSRLSCPTSLLNRQKITSSDALLSLASSSSSFFFFSVFFSCFRYLELFVRTCRL
jgi:hypothetical protein